jgi:hypothetical protein
VAELIAEGTRLSEGVQVQTMNVADVGKECVAESNLHSG